MREFGPSRSPKQSTFAGEPGGLAVRTEIAYGNGRKDRWTTLLPPEGDLWRAAQGVKPAGSAQSNWAPATTKLSDNQVASQPCTADWDEISDTLRRIGCQLVRVTFCFSELRL